MYTGLIQNHRPDLESVATPDGLTFHEMSFALNILQGFAQLEAYRKAFAGECDGLENRKISARASNLKNKPIVKQYLRSLAKELERAAVATALDLQMFLSAAIFTPVGDIDENHPLCQKVKRSTVTTKDGAMIDNEEIVAVPKLEAVKTLIRMKGYDAPIKIDINHKVGVMVVPMASNVDEWEKAAAESQRRLMDDAIDI
jgi:hypothetical protein